MPRKSNRRSTSTSNFGVGRRESHDSSSFYARFVPPEISDDETIIRWGPPDPFICGDARSMDHIPDHSVALVVTSPPYFVGKEYEQALGDGLIPGTYLEYLEMLTSVFSECKKKLEPGGRIAVNVANLGRRPYRSLSADIIQILQDRLKLMLRGEVLWVKSEGASGSCAWGSYRQPRNPVLRDVTERVIIASKGRFDRARTPAEREREGLPFKSSISADEFMEATLDVWRIAPEAARRVGHPAPFPVELPYRLIELYTYEDDLVLDPFMGSGSTLVAAARSSRRYVGYDLDATYVALARERVGAELARRSESPESAPDDPDLTTFRPPDSADNDDFQSRASREGLAAHKMAETLLERSGFEILARNKQMPGIGLEVSFIASDRCGKHWYFDVSGAFTTPRAGLRRTDTLWKCLGRAAVMNADNRPHVVLLTTHLPEPKSAGDRALRSVGPQKIFDAIELLSPRDWNRLRQYAEGGHNSPLTGFWTGSEPDFCCQDNCPSARLPDENAGDRADNGNGDA